MNSLTGVVNDRAAFLHQRQDRDARERLRLRGDAEDRVQGPEPAPLRFLVAPADRHVCTPAGRPEARARRPPRSDSSTCCCRQAIDAGKAIGANPLSALRRRALDGRYRAKPQHDSQDLETGFDLVFQHARHSVSRLFKVASRLETADWAGLKACATRA